MILTHSKIRMDLINLTKNNMFILLFNNDEGMRPIVDPVGHIKEFNNITDAKNYKKLLVDDGQDVSVCRIALDAQEGEEGLND